MPVTTRTRILKTVKEKRKLIRAGQDINWCTVKSRVGFYTKVDANLRQKIDEFVRGHHHIIHSPIAREIHYPSPIPINMVINSFGNPSCYCSAASESFV